MPSSPRLDSPLSAASLTGFLASAALLASAACGSVASQADGGPDAGALGVDGMVGDTDATTSGDAMPDPLAPARLQVDRTSNDFGNVLREQRSASARFLIRNTGDETSGVLATQVTGDHGDFEIVDNCAGMSLDAGASCELHVTFAPSVAGGANATLATEGDPGGSVSIELMGTALLPGALAIDDDDHDFGTVALASDSPSKTFTIENTGDVATGRLQTSVSDTASFEISGDSCAGSVLAAGSRCSLDLVFGPDAVGTTTASLTVSASPGGNTVAALGGVGTALVSVGRAGTGSGEVMSSPVGIACGTRCSAEFDTGAVSLRATAQSGSVFIGWTGDCAGSRSCELLLTEAATVQARFEALRRLTLSRTGDGAGSVVSASVGIDCGSDCSNDYLDGTTVTLSAAAGANSSFQGWTGCDSSSGTTCTMRMDAAKSVSARFNLLPRTLTVIADGAGRGTVSSVPAGISCGADCGQDYSHGTSVTLTASAATGSDFAGWSGCPNPSGRSCTARMDRDRDITANFTLELRTLEVLKSGLGSGTVNSAPVGISCGIDCNQRYLYGTTVGLTAYASSGSTFAGWSGCSRVSGSTCYVDMTIDRSPRATFNRVRYSLDVIHANTRHGTVTSSPAGISCGTDCTGSYNSGTSVTLSGIPDRGYTVGAWSGCDSTTRSTCTVSMRRSREVSIRWGMVALR